jgi:hypothetical protein
MGPREQGHYMKAVGVQKGIEVAMSPPIALLNFAITSPFAALDVRQEG